MEHTVHSYFEYNYVWQFGIEISKNLTSKKAVPQWEGDFVLNLKSKFNLWHHKRGRSA